MLRLSAIGLLSLAGLMGLASPGNAQVFVRAPFVRVFVGGPGGPGVGVRAPFVNIWVPNRYYYPPSVMYLPPPPPPVTQAPSAESQPSVPSVQPSPQSAPRIAPEAEVPPAPRSTQDNPMTLDQFAKAFQPRAGNYDVTL